MDTNDLAQLNRGTAQGAGDGDTGYDGSLKIIDNFNELDQRTNKSNPFRRVFVPVDFSIQNEVMRLIAGLNSMSLRDVDARMSYLLVTNRSTASISSGSGTFTNISRVYALSTVLNNGDTIGSGGSFQFDLSNINYQFISENVKQVVDGVVIGGDVLDLGIIGNVSISSAVNGLDPKVPITGAPYLIKSNDGTEDNFHFYIGDETCLGVGVVTDSTDFVLLNATDPPVSADASNYLIVRPFGNPFQLRKDPANDNPDNIGVLETNDVILNGFNVDDTEFWEAAKYIGTDPANDINLPASYVVLGGGTGGGGGAPQVQSDFAETDSALPSFILNKITNTSGLINDGDGNSPFATFNNLPSVPTVTSDLTNDGNGIEPFLTDSDVAGTYRRLDDSNIYTPGDLATENIGLADYYDIGNVMQPYYHIKLPYDDTTTSRYTVSIRGSSTGSKTSIDIRYIGQMFSSNGIVNDFTSIIHDNTDAGQGIAGAGQYVSSDGFAVLWFQLQNTGNSTRFRVDSMLTGSGDIINDGQITISQTDSTTPTI